MPQRSPGPRRPKPGAAPPAPKPWRREDGRYRSADDRFTIEGGAARWFVTDTGSLDELGLARTLGPYQTLDQAREAAAAQREQEGSPSPLADRLAAAGDRPRPGAHRPEGRTGADAPSDRQRTSKRGGGQAARAAAGRPGHEPAEAVRTWLDDLEDEDPAAAPRARRLVAALEALGVDDAEAVVRRDVLGHQPAIATRLLARTLAGGLRTALEPAALAAARSTIPGPMRVLGDADQAALAAYAVLVAGRVLEATLDAVAAREQADGTARELPGWRLVERPGTGGDGDAPARRIIVTPADVLGGGTT